MEGVSTEGDPSKKMVGKGQVAALKLGISGSLPVLEITQSLIDRNQVWDRVAGWASDQGLEQRWQPTAQSDFKKQKNKKGLEL